jgi:hypothetical protein
MTVRHTAPRRLCRLLPAAALLLAAPLAGCGDQTSSATPDASSGSPTTAETGPTSGGGEPFATDRAWVARFETGSDEVADGVAYVRFDPSSGTTKVTEITGPPLDFEPNPYLLVDAGRTVAVRANSSSIKEERAGSLTLYPLDRGKKRAVDLREVTGVDTLHPIGWAFDPTEAGLLRILDRSGRLFEWNVGEDTATEVDAVEVGKGFELAPYFNGADGMPLLRDKRTYKVEKSGDYTAGGAAVVTTDRSPCPGRTTLARTVQDASGTAWTGCLVGDKVVLFQKADGDTAWKEAGASTADVPKDAQTMTWALPTVA